VARDAIARQLDVDENSVELTVEPGEGRYRPGTIAFQAKPDSSVNVAAIRDSIADTRLSGNTNMRVDYLEITVRGAVTLRDGEPVMTSESSEGPGQQFLLAGDDRDLHRRLRPARDGRRLDRGMPAPGKRWLSGRRMSGVRS
jgi:hypothetical protein